jgi:methionyl-tRNA formyltransferase
MTPFIFFGTDEFAVKVLAELKSQNLVPEQIMTTEGKGSRRGESLISPVETWAKENQVLFSYDLKSGNYDLFIVASYGKILTKEILALPKHGTLNIHPSILPKYRGATPLQSAILNGDTETGVSIMLLDEEMDHGQILISKTYPLTPKTSFVLLRNELARLGAQALIEILPDYLAGEIKPTEQNHSAATYTKKITKGLGQLNLADSPELNDRKIRALNPNPGTYFVDENSKRVKVLAAHIEEGKLIFDRIVPEGRKEMTWESYLRGLTK